MFSSFRKKTEAAVSTKTEEVLAPTPEPAKGNEPEDNSDAGAEMEEEKEVSADQALKKSGDGKKKILAKLAKAEEELEQAQQQIATEKATKRKLYSSLVKLANELKKTRDETKGLVAAAKYADKSWYEGGIWREPRLLPGIDAPTPSKRPLKDAVSLSDLFFDLVIVTAFTRAGDAVADRGMVDGPTLAYFAIFFTIWQKEASYSTRFETTDLSAQMETLLTCFAVLFGSLSTTKPFQSNDGTRMMMVAAFVAILHFFLHVRVAYWYRDAMPDSLEDDVRKYAWLIMAMSVVETLVWFLGIFVFPEESPQRWVIFLIGIIFSLRVPKSFLANNFHAACSKRGVLFILLLGFLLQSIVVTATPFFDYDTPSPEQYTFLGLTCFILFCIKLLYVDDSFSIDPSDHALLVNRLAGFLFYVGNFLLLLATTVLGAGLDLLTHSYLAATAALPDNAKNLVCGGFSCVILSIAFIKSMHLRRVPTNPKHERMFFAAYGVQIIVLFLVASITASMCFSGNGYIRDLMLDEIEMMFVLSGFALLLVIMSWLDEAVELSLYGTGVESREFRIHPFGIWACLKPDVAAPSSAVPEPPPDGKLAHLSPLLGTSMASLRYSSIPNLDLDDASGPKPADLGSGGGETAHQVV